MLVKDHTKSYDSKSFVLIYFNLFGRNIGNNYLTR